MFRTCINAVFILCICVAIHIHEHSIRLVLFDLDDVLVEKSLTTCVLSSIQSGCSQCVDHHIIPEGKHLLDIIQHENADCNDITYCILSNATKNHMHRITHNNNAIRSLSSQFDQCFFLGHYHTAKPRPEVFTKVASTYHVPPHACLFIDDNIYNVIGARNAGMYAVLFNRWNMQHTYDYVRDSGLIR